MDRIMGKGFFVPAVALIVAMLPGMALAAADCSGGLILFIPDGRIEAVSVPTTGDKIGAFKVVEGRSYCLEVNQLDWSDAVALSGLDYTTSCMDTTTTDRES